MHPIERRDAREWLEKRSEPGPENPLPDHVLELLAERDAEAKAVAERAEILGAEYSKLHAQVDTARVIIDTFEADYPKEYEATLAKLTKGSPDDPTREPRPAS